MATLEDKLLGNKAHNYCSSSEDEDGPDASGVKFTPADPKDQAISGGTNWTGSSANTGPKGVIKDWQRFKQLETEKRNEQERERVELMKKLSLSARTTAEDDKAKEQDEFDAELAELMNDDFLLQYQKQRMTEMLAMAGRLPRFGNVVALSSGDDFLNAVDKEHKGITVIIHIYEDRNSNCAMMNECLKTLATEYVMVKFCKIKSSVAGMSKKFKTTGLPALLIYKNGQVIGNFVRMADELGNQFYASDVESFLIEHSLLPDKTCVPTITSQQGNDEDDDE
jgi:predicted RecB family endonuclease